MQCLFVRASTSHNFNSTLFYHSKKSLYHYIIPFYNIFSIPIFYFSILLIKIIYLHNKIIFPPIIIIYSFFLILSIQQPQILQKTPSPHAHHRCTTHTWHHHHHHQPIIYHEHQKKKKKPRPSNTKHQSPKHHSPSSYHFTILLASQTFIFLFYLLK